MSIGVLGFVVWSQVVVALFCREVEVINFAVCWDSLKLIYTFLVKNYISYAESAGNLSLFILFSLIETKWDYLYSMHKYKKVILFCLHTKAFAPKTSEKDKGKETDKRTPETTRETSFNFEAFRALTGITADKISDAWLTWFIGFSEGDGAILMNGRYPRFVLTQKEIPILHHIQETLGIGKVSVFKQFGRFIVTNSNEILILIALFNGNLVLEKRKIQIKRWLIAKNITEITNTILPLLSNAWLSGLIDAEGCFNVTLFKRASMALGYQVKLRFMIDQKDSLEVRSFNDVKSIITYLRNYRLKTKKQMSFDKWVRVYKLVCNKAHLTTQGLEEIRKIKKEINLINSVTGKTGRKCVKKDKKYVIFKLL